jgi:hypothetical protein
LGLAAKHSPWRVTEDDLHQFINKEKTNA